MFDDRDKDKNMENDQNQPGEEQKKTEASAGNGDSDILGPTRIDDQSGEAAEHREELNPHWREELEGTLSPPQKKASLSRGKKIAIGFGGLLLILIVAAGTYVMAFYTEVQDPERVLLADRAFKEEAPAVDDAFSERIVNIALLGFDRGWNREEYGEYLFRPDMIAVFSIDFEADEISVVRIPRDSYVPIHGMGGFHDKINHAYFYGHYYGDSEDREKYGIEYTLETIKKTLGDIPIHYYVSVDMYSVIELVDAMGGIYYEVEEEIIDKHWEIGRVLVPEGPQIMDGKTFLRYLQYRDSSSAQDEGRMDRQMNLLQETFYHLREEGRITDIPATYRIYKDYVDTDLTYTQIAAMAYYARDLDLDDDTLRFYTLTGGGQMKDGIYYKVLRQDYRRQVISDVFGIDVAAWPPIVLEDSPEYIEEQKRLEREEMEQGGRDRDGLEEKEDNKKEVAGDSGSEEYAVNGEQDQQTANGYSSSERELIPEIRRMKLAEAKMLLREAGFVVGEVKMRSHGFIDEGLVIRSEPTMGGLFRVGTVVNLVVSEGPRDY